MLPPILGPPGGDVWQDCPNMLPARRKYLMSFQGQLDTTETALIDRKVLQKLESFPNATSDEFLFHFTCEPPTVSLRS